MFSSCTKKKVSNGVCLLGFLELLIARELETKMVTDITASVPSGATSLQIHQATNASRSHEVCVGGDSNPISQPLGPHRNDVVVVSAESIALYPAFVESSAGPQSPHPGPNEKVDDHTWCVAWEEGRVPFGRRQCGSRIPHWLICGCWRRDE